MRARNRHDAATTLAPGVPGSGPQGLRERMKPYRNRIAIAFIIIGGIAFAAGWNPPTNTVHSFSEASDYNARRESGCTNSGDGCHGFDEKRRDFNDYHPETACRTCHEYTGVGCIPCHGPSQRECTGCHDGTMPGASDCVRLSDPYPSGHYRESLHTAMGTDMGQIMRAIDGGDAQATCGDCHSRDLKTAHTGVRRGATTEHEASVGCAECHNDIQSGALEQVKTDWPLHRCDDCHGEKVRAPMHATDFAPSSVEGSGTAGCGDIGIGCHSGNKLHALHPNAPKTCSGAAADGEPGCHDLGTQAPRPTEAACGGEGTCHPTYVNTEYSHKSDADAHSAAEGRQGAATLIDRRSGVTVTCAVCHSMDIGMEHTRPNAVLAGDACLGCHNASEQTAAVVKASWPERESTDACAACHGDDIHGGMDGAHVAAQLDRETGKPVEGSCVRAGCHATADVRALHAAKGCTLTGCHSRTGRISGSAPMSCGGPEGTEGACHVGADKHRNFYASHTGVELDRETGEPSPGSCARDGCHGSVSVYELHHDVGCEIEGCHVAGGPSGIVSCGGPEGTEGACHVGADKHRNFYAKHLMTELDDLGYAEPGACSATGCHGTSSAYELHHDVGCEIEGCHVAGGLQITSCGGTPETEGACHRAGTRHDTFGTDHDGIPVNNNTGVPQQTACVRDGCHATVVLYVLHERKGCTIAGCHEVTGERPAMKTCGGPNGSGNCHERSTQHIYSTQMHAAVELNASGVVQPGACYCHFREGVDAVDVRRVRRATPPDTPTATAAHGCYSTAGCHVAGGPFSATCGGNNATLSCHTAGGTGRVPSSFCVIPAAGTTVWLPAHAPSTSTPGVSGEPTATSPAKRPEEPTATATPHPADEPSAAPAAVSKDDDVLAQHPEQTDATPVCLSCHELSEEPAAPETSAPTKETTETQGGE